MVQSQVTKTAVLACALCSAALGQLNQNCTVSVLNRSVPVNPDGSWVLPNIPANFGQVKARATCVQNGQTIFGESAYFTVPANGAANLPAITLGNTTQIPVSLSIGPAAPLTTAGQTVQLSVKATYPDNSVKDVSAGGTGTNYTISNAAIASISANGLVTAVSSGTVVIQASNDGASGIITVQVNLGGANVGGIPLTWILANHLDPNDPTLPYEDPDQDGLTNLLEYQWGTDPNNPDTDGDGLTDGDEVNKYHTNPLLTDTDNDKIPDGVEVQTGTDPLNPNSYDLKKATANFTLTPASFVLSTSILSPNVSAQLNWKVNLIDSKTTLDLTADPRTHYSSSNLNICNFDPQPGLVFAGTAGTCVITISQSTLSVTVPGQVTTFTPVEVSTLSVPGSVAVDVAGNFAYIAAGSSGLVVVDITDRTKPKTRGTLSGLGNAVAIRVDGLYVLIADSAGFLRVVQVLNPDAPSLAASLPITGTPAALSVHSSIAAVAAQGGGVSLVNIATPTAPSLIARFTVPGSALGVDFDLQRGLAAVAMGTAGLQLADISNQAAPQLRGLLAGGNVLRVRLIGTAALLADTQRSVTAVDVTNPAAPVLSSSIPANLGGAPVDIAAFGNVAITADQSFGRAVPVISIANPLQPSTVLFWTISPPGFGSSIAMDASFGYLIIPGTLRILQYQDIVDTAGIPPAVQITYPTPGITLIQGSTITVTVNATDDVAVASVSLLVNGQVAGTTSAAPYQLAYTVPANATSLTFTATAVDYGNNVGTSAGVQVSVIPDPGTTVSGKVVDGQNNSVGGATVTTVGSLSSTTAADGSFSIAHVSTIRGNIVVVAFVTNGASGLAGVSGSFPPVRGGVTNVGAITVLPVPVISGLSAKSALAGSQVNLQVTGTTLSGSTFAFQPVATSPIAIQVVSTSPDGTSATLALNIPASTVGTFALVATDIAGNSGSIVTPFNRFTTVDPNSTADTDGDGFQDAIEAVYGTDPLDPGSFPVILPATETESVSFSVLNSPVTGAGIIETEGVFSVLNSPVTGAGIVETENTFSVLNSPVTGAGIVETENTFSVLNSPVTGAGIVEAESVAFSVSNKLAAVVRPRSEGPETTPDTRNGDAPKSAAEPPPIDPLLDSDGDGLPDWFEALLGTDPYNADTDGDGLSDFDELFTYHTNPLDPDTDGDGFTDGEEVFFGSDPLNPGSTPLNIRRRAEAPQPGKNDIAIVAANNEIKKNSTKQGDAHVKQRSRKASRGKGARTSDVSGSFDLRRSSH